MKIAAIADLHFRSAGNDEETLGLLTGVEKEADVLVLAGDLTESGLPAEMEVLLGTLRSISLPVVAVLGNHDHESDQAARLIRMMNQAGVRVLDGGSCEVQGVEFIGTKGFGGGFGERLIQPFGERQIKNFVQTGLQEALALEEELASLDPARRVAVMHYSPIETTLDGEARELYPFLGCSRLGDALDRHGVDMAVHGHAHHGSAEGRTSGNIPVYNVSRFVCRLKGSRPWRLLEI